MCKMFGGPSREEETLAGQESNLAQDLLANYKEQYGKREDVLRQLGGEISRIQSGNTGPGFGGAENAALISDIQNKGAAAARNAIQATQERAAGQRFQGVTDSAGLARAAAIRQQVNAAITTGAEIRTANALNAETAANYEQGRRNAAATASGLATLAGEYTPLQYASGASAATQSAFGMQHEINKEKAERAAAIGGLVKKGIGMAAGAVTGGLAAGGGFWDILKGAAGGALGDEGMFLTNPGGGAQG
jgi:hypothetical protein